MLAEAASPWGLDIRFLDKDVHFPVASINRAFVEGNFKNYEDVLEFGSQMDIVTVEIESVNLEALKELKKRGIQVNPSPEILETVIDKGRQAEFYAEHGFPIPKHTSYDNLSNIRLALQNGLLSYPFVQKARRDGYDGRGVAIINGPADLDKLMDVPSIVQEKIEIEKELAVMVARNAGGEVAVYPPVEMVFTNIANLLDYQSCPASIDHALALDLQKLSLELADHFDLVGIMAVEFFLDKAGKIWVNEVAPRPHNSGHHTIEAAVTSQFEQHLRAILNLPLGNTDLTYSSVMINVLGEPGFEGPAKIDGSEQILGETGAHLHWYGKKETRPFRKMGHLTLCGPDIEALKARVSAFKKTVKVIA